ncbi:YceI family protein [Paenibacillaceae bacterium]|nr:YceI family protein [Paenibacillaceae bacterium]
MNKNKKWIMAGAGALILVGAGGYAMLNSYLGNKVEITQVIPAKNIAAGESGASSVESGDAKSQTFAGQKLNGEWHITRDSKVYFSVTTSKETVNFENNAVTGSWTINLDDPSGMIGTGSVELGQINSGNNQRDDHIKSADFFDIEQHPQAAFKASSFEGLPAEWQEGTAYDFIMPGSLTVRGVDKDVTFAGKAMYQDNQLKLSGTTTVTFQDFGMENPHSVLVSTENDIAVQLELVLKK